MRTARATGGSVLEASPGVVHPGIPHPTAGVNADRTNDDGTPGGRRGARDGNLSLN